MKRKYVNACLIAIISVLITLIFMFTYKKVIKTTNNVTNPEILRSMTYAQVTDKDSKVDNCEYVKFNAFFTRDLNNDGNAEMLLGTCREINSTDTLYMDINVLTDGYLENGVIEIRSSNFNYSMNMVKDNVLKNNYISKNVKKIQLNTIKAGTQKLILGDVVANIGNNTNNYSNVSSVTLKGTHVTDDGQTRTPISKTINLTVDWHGKTSARIYTSSVYYNFDELNSDIISFNFTADEKNEQLILQENFSTLVIPNLNGYAPLEVKCTNSNVEFNYDEGTQKLTIRRASAINEKGIITKTLISSNSYNITVKYPQEAYDQISSYTQLQIPIQTYYTGYNNSNEQFDNPYKSNIAKANVSIIFREKPKGRIYDFEVYIRDKKSVIRPYSRYAISKQDILNAYDSVELVENKKYTIQWYATRGSEGEVESLIMSETKQSDEKYGDKLDSIIIDDYTVNTGIYFSNVTSMLGENGTISVYNDETNELIKTFINNEWENYTKEQPYKYEVPVKHIRIETSAANVNSSLSVYHLKELNIEKIKEDISKEKIEEIQTISTYLTGVCNIVGQEAGKENDIDSAYLVSEVSNAEISISNSEFITQQTYNNQKITIDVNETQLGDAKWQNGMFIVELPVEILKLDIKKVETNNSNVEIIAYDVQKQDNRNLIKIITKNEQPEVFKIIITTDITPDPRVADSKSFMELYAYNEYCDKYYNISSDYYDVNGNNDVNDNVGNDYLKLSFISPTGLITMETITNYDESNKEAITVAPNVAELNKEQKTATVNVNIANNYPDSISGIRVLGKIPFEGNTYAINGSDMNSKFSTTMTNEGIHIPEELEDKIVIYYSENANPTKDLTIAQNGWKTKENVDDFSKIKTYLIDFKNYIMEISETCSFSYNIMLPENLDYNITSYSDHAVYYELNTQGGKLQLATEPNKVGIRSVRHFGLELNKSKKDMETLKVPGAIYKVEYIDNENNVINRILTTDSEGNIKLDNLYVGFNYTVKEIQAPANYVTNNDVFEFKIIQDEQEKLKIETNNNTNITFDEKNETVRIKTEDEPRYNITITKTDPNTDESLADVKFIMDEKIYTTDSQGQILFERLVQNREYKLKEILADGYYLLDEITFKLVKDNDGNFKLESNSNDFKSAIIQNTETEHLINVEVNLKNEKIPTYNLQVLKVVENENEDNIENLTPIQGVKFKLEYQDLQIEESFTTDEKGYINIDNLYQYVEGKYITGKYLLQEIEAPEGYSNLAEEISFRVRKDENGEFVVDIENKENLKSIKDVKIEEDKIIFVIENKPLFKLIKTDNKTQMPLANAKFSIYELDKYGNYIGYAKDTNGNFVGEKNEYDEYVIATNESGIIMAALKNGYYKVLEVESPTGYAINENEYYFKVGQEEEEDNSEIVEINYIEDLIDLRINTSAGNTYSGKTVKLMRNLSFYNSSSYRNADSYSYGDYNKNNKTETLKTELTTGSGFKSIGIFSGVFDGQGYSINGLYADSQSNYSFDYGGLFGTVENGTIKNLTVSGNLKTGTSGMIAAYITNSTIENCSARGYIDSLGNRTGGTAGGIVGKAYSSTIRNCYTTNIQVQGGHTGAIVGEIQYTTISNCYNRANLNDSMGGIVGYAINNNSINGCYNAGYINGNSQNVGGIVGEVSGSGCCITKCYNTGILNLIGTSRAYAGGIVGKAENASLTILNCYNTGIVKSVYYAGGIVGNASTNINIKNCYNAADISGNLGLGKIVGYDGGNQLSNNIVNCYYLESAKETSLDKYATILSSEYMKTREFYNKLNTDNAWLYRNELYPRLNIGLIANIRETINLNITNNLKTFNITTEIAENSEIKRTGGNITGEYNNNYEEALNIKFVESVEYGNSNSKAVEIVPDGNYIISEIRINGEIVEFKKDDNGNVIIPEQYFSNVVEDKHIIVVFEPINNLIIKKVDENNNEINLAGAIFKVEKNINLNDYIGYIQHGSNSQTTHHFEKVGDTYVSTNKGRPNSVSNSYFPINLEKFEGKSIQLEINATISSESETTDYGYAIVTNSETVPYYGQTAGLIMKIAGISTKTYYKTLQGGQTYYLHIGYRKNSNYDRYNDKFIINSIKLTSSEPLKESIEVSTNEDGIANFKVPSNVDITVTEVKAPFGYELDSTPQTITLAEGEIKELTITNKQKNTKIKVIKLDAETNKPLPDAKFLLKNDVNNYETIITTNENGEIEISVENGIYTLKEIEAPKGYELNEEIQTIEIQNESKEVIVKNTPKKVNITTKVERTPSQQVDGGTISGKDEQPYEEVSYSQTSTKDILIDPDNGYKIVSIKINGEQIEFTPDENGNVLLDKFVDMREDKEVVVRFEPVYEANFTLLKLDDYTNKPLEGIQFAIYYISAGNDFAKDKNGYYIGQKDENGMYVVTTDSNGEVKLAIPTGLYKAVEVKGANGYVLPEKEEERTTYFRVVANANIEINYIEDLIELSNNVTNGNTYEGKVIGLARDLDFNDVSSYRNANDTTTYGDYNGNGIVETIKDELTNISSSGFKPIGGNPGTAFSGIFDGNGFELKNVYINSSYGSLFTYVLNGEILNLKVTNANITNTSCGAGFAYFLTYSKISNCGIDGKITSSSNAPTGGIAYTANYSEIINCYNNADVSGVCTAGISSYITNSLIEKCYNTGNLTSTGPAGGFGYSISNSTIKNCYNTGDVNGTGTSGGIASSISESTIENCYNTGKINDSSAPAGGLAYSISNCNIKNFYNTGDVFGKSGAGGMAYSIYNSNLEKCYNQGNISSTNNSAAGIGLNISNSSFKECYNKGDVSSEYTSYSDTTGAAGFAMTFTNSTAEKCFNEGNITSKVHAAGFSLKAEGSNLEKCYNKGTIEASSCAAGLVYISEDCVCKNLYNKGNVTSNGPNAGILYVASNSTVEQCANMATVKANAPAAGVVYNAVNSNIIKCYNTGEVYGPSCAGGVVYSTSNCIIQDCYNTGNVYSNVPAGGIVYTANTTMINNCYNIGTVSGNYCVGGIIEYADSNSSINNCYNAGKIITDASSTGEPIGGIAYSASISNLKDTYYLNTTAKTGIYNVADVEGAIESKTAMQMISRTFVNELNNNKTSIETTIPLSNWKYNLGRYPVLDYEIDIYEYNTGSEQQPGNTNGNISTENNTNQTMITPNYEKVESELTITNSKLAKIIVHHYLEGTGPEYENEPTILAPDEIIMGKENYDYVTAPNLDIEGYNLIQDTNGEYIIPENASGKYTLEEQHIYYYYNIKPLELVVHHYLEGTEDKLAEDEQYFYNENDHYKVIPSEELLSAYEVVLVVGDEEKDITQNEVVTYYYKKKEYKITTKVVIPESEVEAGRTENGGTILGEGEQPYEVVKHGENSVKDIVATPDSGYKVSSKTVNGKVVPFTIQGGVITLDKFENMTEDKEVIVEFMPIIGKVITHHYIQGTTEKLHEDIINIDKVGAVVGTSPIEIDGYKLVGSEGNKDEDGNVVIVKEVHEGVEEIIYYYQKAYIITTDVIEHEENYKDGTVKQGIKGGSITNEDVVIHEQVVRYEDNVKVIEMKPDEGYEVVEVRVNGKVVAFEKDGSENGNLTIPEGFFTNVQEDIHVEVQYRRNSKVIVKYLEEGTEKELAEITEILGYEGKEFETVGKVIPGYIFVMEVISNGNQDGAQDGNQDDNQGGNQETIKITDENNQPTQPNGTMFTDDITVIYWYEKIDADVIERHIEINEKGEEIELEFVVHNADTAATVETLRKQYERYGSIDAPEETKEKIEKDYPNVTLVGKDKDSHTVEVDTENVQEVWYYYIKQYYITTEVKPHKEIINETEIEVEGGTISKEYKTDENGEKIEDIYEAVNSRADSSKEIKMVPEDGYRIKSVTINDEEIYIDTMVAEDGSLLLPVAYFKDVQKDYHVVVEYEKIPAKVIVKYIDEYTKESILPDKVIEGFVNDEYNESRVEVDSYIAVEPEPENSQGKMIDEVITIVYYYGKQYKITTDVIEHLEDKEKSLVDVIIDKIDDAIDEINGSKVLVKGGNIQGEDEESYETVSRGKNNIKEILIKPDDGYRIKTLKIKDGETEFILSVPDLLTKENTIILPKEYFKNMQSDKHIMVEFEPIPAKVVVNYLDIETKEIEKPEKVSTSEEGKGFVNYDYKTYAKDVPYYELVQEEMPSNAEGKLTEEDTVVNYWYRKLLFNMKITKEFSSIQVNGEEKLQDNKKFAKIDIANTEVGSTNILVKYKITVTNTEKVEGVAKVVENIPVGFKYVAGEWQEVDGKLELTTKTLKPGETVEYEITLEWDKNQNCIGNLINTATITETQNIPQYEETTKEDNKDSCTLILAIRTRENRDIKTIVSISCFVLAGICTAVYVGMEVYARRKER